MIDRRDPEHNDVRRYRAEVACARFNAGDTTESVFRASLFALGYRGAEIHAEVVANWPGQVAPQLLTTTGFVSGLR